VHFAKISAHTSLLDENSEPMSFQILQEPDYCQPSGLPTIRPEGELGLGACTPAPLPAFRRYTHFKPRGRPLLQGGEGLSVV